MARAKTDLPAFAQQQAIHFGAFVKSLRSRHGLRQLDVLAHLPGWTQANYSRVENGEQAPPFDQLLTIYTALHTAGVELAARDRQQFLTLARVRIEVKKSHLDRKSDQEWDILRLALSQFDHAPAESVPASHERLLSRPHLMETRHLAGRDDWFASVVTSLRGPFPKKLLVLRGPTGIGKSSELHRLARHFLTKEPHRHVVLCVLPNVEHHSEPDNALDQLLGSLLVEVGPPDAAIQKATLTVRIAFVLDCLQKAATPVLVLMDNAEQLLDEQGQLAACWKLFLTQWLRSQADASLILATNEWPGWYNGEGLFVAERRVPPLTMDESTGVLQRLGLASVPAVYLQQASERAGGIPLCLEWIVTLVKKPPLLDSWDDLDELSDADDDATTEVLARRLVRLLEGQTLVHSEIASRLQPMLDRILHQRLSEEALKVLHILSLGAIPLGKLPLQRLCLRPSLLKELRTVSLLTAHSERVQVLPLVAAVVREQLSAEQQQAYEEQLIDAYHHWLHEGEMSDREMGAIIAELLTMYMKRCRLLDAAQLLIYYGWMCFNLGHGPRLARLVQKTMQHNEWRLSPERECGALLLYHVLTPFLGKPVSAEKQAADFQHILALTTEGKVLLQPATEMHPIHLLMVYHMNHRRFEEAQTVLTAGAARLKRYQHEHLDVQASLLAHRALLLAKWSNHLEEQGAIENVSAMRVEVIALYRQCCELLSATPEISPLKSRLLKKRLSGYFNYLGYHLIRSGQAVEALPFLEQSILLAEQGYCNFGALAAAYGDMSQALMELGRFDEALFFDEKALAEVQRCADSGDAFSQDEVWVYRVNRGQLYLRLGRLEEAETLLRDAERHIHPRRSSYRLLARRALEEIERQRYQQRDQ